MVQLFTACPSTITVHAPHNEVSQPTCVPVRFSTSRMYCTSSRRGSISFWCVTPFTVTLIVFFMDHLVFRGLGTSAAWELPDARHTKCFAKDLPYPLAGDDEERRLASRMLGLSLAAECHKDDYLQISASAAANSFMASAKSRRISFIKVCGLSC